MLTKLKDSFNGFDFTKGAPVLKVPALSDAKRPPMQGGGFTESGTRLYDLSLDPQQDSPFRDDGIEADFREAIEREMKHHDAPDELFIRFSS